MFYRFLLWHKVLLGNVIFQRGVGNFDLHFLIHFFPKWGCSCAHQTGNFLNFPKLTLLLSVVHFQGVLWAFKDKSHFFLGHPVDTYPIHQQLASPLTYRQLPYPLVASYPVNFQLATALTSSQLPHLLVASYPIYQQLVTQSTSSQLPH